MASIKAITWGSDTEFWTLQYGPALDEIDASLFLEGIDQKVFLLMPAGSLKRMLPHSIRSADMTMLLAHHILLFRKSQTSWSKLGKEQIPKARQENVDPHHLRI